MHPKTRTIGEDLAGLANAPINVVTNSQLDQFARGNERHPAAGPATDAMPSQGTARPKIVFGGTKTRPFQRLKLSREAKVFSAGRDGAITYRTNNARIASNASASQRLAQNRSTPSASSARLPYETESSIAEPKNAGWTTQSQAVQQDAHAAERLRPVNPVALTARTTRRAAVLSGASTPAVKAISPSDGQRAAGRQLINARQPSAARMPASVRSAGLPARIAPAGVTAVQLRRAAPRAAPPPDLAAFPAAAQSAARAHSPIAAASAASANPDAAQQHRAASRTAAAATETALAPAAATLQRSARQASAPSAQPRPAPAAELRLRRSQQAGSPAAPPLAAPSAELELRRTPKAAAPAQPQPMQPIAQEPPRLSTEQLQQAVREMPELDPERLADTVYTALMRRMKFEQRLSGY
ncbi:hypothetical protein ACFSR7_22095 [Cohnella sp. GCM10020058]|uniref:hypothetical protein n=1 Tax=Cohnella sp. GCM10020058 TaxID=3317330 RepID=UPI00362F8D35